MKTGKPVLLPVLGIKGPWDHRPVAREASSVERVLEIESERGVYTYRVPAGARYAFYEGFTRAAVAS